MIEKDKLKEYARLLMFDMDDDEYSVLQDEFETILKQMDLIGKIPNIDKVSPMTFPFKNEDVSLRDTKHQVNDQVKVPKVVDEDV